MVCLIYQDHLLKNFAYKCFIINYKYDYNFNVINKDNFKKNIVMSKNVPINSVYGDTGSVEATYTKDLNTIGNDPYVRVIANSGEFNLFQQMNLSDNFYDSRFEEVYVTQNSAGATGALSLASLQFNTMGWTRADRMYLQVPVVLNWIASNCWHEQGADQEIDYYAEDHNDPSIQNISASIIRNAEYDAGLLTVQAGNEDFNKWVCNQTQVDWAMMEIFNRIQIYGGNNNQPIGRTQSFYKEGLKTQLREVPWNSNNVKLLGNWGLPVSNLGCVSSSLRTIGENIASIGSYLPYYFGDSINPNLTCVPDDWIKSWAKTLLCCDPITHGTSLNSMMPLPGSDNRAVYNQARVNLTLPLSFINNFFRHKTYLPPDFKFKIDVEGVSQPLGVEPNYNCPLIIVGNLNQINPRLNYNRTEAASCWGMSGGIDFSGLKIIYQNHTLRQPIQAQINEKWVSYPIVYNYETFETYDVDNSANSSTTMIVRDIAISQQRPTQLIFQIIDTVTQCPDLRGNWVLPINGPQSWLVSALQTQRVPYQFTAVTNTAGTMVNVPHGTSQKGSTPWFTDLSIYGSQPTVSGALSSHGNLPQIAGKGRATQVINSEYPIITTISTLIGGRTQYYYKNDSDSNYKYGNIPMNAYDVLIAETDSECYKDYSNDTNNMKVPISYTSLGGTGVFQRLTIAPGGYVNTADLPTDLGATVIRVQVTLSRPLPTTKKLQIVKKMPEQIAVDTNKNCTLIMWPAIKSNNGFAVPNVVNTQ